MTFKAAKCPNCAGDLQVPEDRDSVKCMYCGSDIIVREAIKLAGGVNVENLTELIKCAKDSGNWKEVYQYSTQILEVDYQNHEAWRWKGISAAELSTFSDIKFLEAFKHLQKATEYVPPIKKDELINLIIFTINRKSNELLNSIDSGHLSANDLIMGCGNLIKGLEEVNDAFNNKEIMETIVNILTNFFYHAAKGGLSQAYNMKVIKLLNNYDSKKIYYINKIRTVDPSYTVKKNSNCFIATSVYGSPFSQEVILLKTFRDDYLYLKSWGRHMGYLYYICSPNIALVISNSEVLKGVTRLLLSPIIFLIKRYFASK